ncbi:MAG: hypothetical protein M3Q69_16445 [Acidobacteriota bacterium]|nr:hypothetical protein [Acidobacteriota bacterium]
MGTINQPTPSSPKSPQPDQQPLHPGGPQVSRNNTTADPQEPNVQTPDTQRDKTGQG